MSIVKGRAAVLGLYEEMRRKGRVIPCFCSENLTTTEAILEAAARRGRDLGEGGLPVIVAITCNYAHRRQAAFYTSTRDWRTGLRLFLADLGVLAGPGGPYEDLRVMVHLDHAQFDEDEELLGGDLSGFSSVMFDASRLPFDENIELTRRFVEERGSELLVEGACDEIRDATGAERGELTDGARALRFLEETHVDLMVANLGTEHRASGADLRYRGDKAREISDLAGPRIVLHGVSSVPVEQVSGLFLDGVRKANIWTALERDSTPALLEDMVRNAAKAAGPELAARLAREGLLGPRADLDSRASLSFFTTAYRQSIVHRAMSDIALAYLEAWYL